MGGSYETEKNNAVKVAVLTRGCKLLGMCEVHWQRCTVRVAVDLYFYACDRQSGLSLKVTYMKRAALYICPFVWIYMLPTQDTVTDKYSAAPCLETAMKTPQ